MADEKKLTKDQQSFLEDVLAHTADLANDLSVLFEETNGGRPISREFAIVLTKLEEAEMWASRGFESLGYELTPAEDEDGEPDGEPDDPNDEEE